MVFAETNVWDAASQLFIVLGIIFSSFFAYRANSKAKETNRDIATNNGKRPGEYLELIEGLIDLQKDLQKDFQKDATAHKSDATRSDMALVHRVLRKQSTAEAELGEALTTAIGELKDGA